MTKQECGRLGGLATATRHGAEFMRQTGSLGGRPRLWRRYEPKEKEERLPTRTKAQVWLWLNQIKEMA